MRTTEITTAARRITRHINSTAPGLNIYYDRDGQQVAACPAGMWLEPWPTGAVIKITSGHHSLRGVQDMIDAWIAHPEDGFERNAYLASLDD